MKQRHFYTAILGLFFCLNWAATRAQTTYLRLDSVLVNSFITSFNDSIPISGDLTAYSDSLGIIPTSYQGDVSFLMLSDSMIAAGTQPRVFDTMNVSLAPVTGQSITTYLDIRTNELRSGPNVIIVWPGYASTVVALDSAFLDVTVDGYLYIPSLPKTEMVLFPNPAMQHFYISGMEDGAIRIRILDISGKIMEEENIPAGNELRTISVQHLPAGLYIITLQMPDGSGRSLRLIKK